MMFTCVGGNETSTLCAFCNKSITCKGDFPFPFQASDYNHTESEVRSQNAGDRILL